MTELFQFLSGALAMGFGMAGLFFLRFWRKSGERLFFVFAVSFWLIAVERVVTLVLPGYDREKHSYVYVIRLVAFALILLGIVDKNRAVRAGGGPFSEDRSKTA